MFFQERTLNVHVNLLVFVVLQRRDVRHLWPAMTFRYKCSMFNVHFMINCLKFYRPLKSKTRFRASRYIHPTLAPLPRPDRIHVSTSLLVIRANPLGVSICTATIRAYSSEKQCSYLIRTFRPKFPLRRIILSSINSSDNLCRSPVH